MRYQVYEGSKSAHCCFDATVIDTDKPTIVHGKHYVNSKGELDYETVCECFDMADAKLICDALNAAAQAHND